MIQQKSGYMIIARMVEISRTLPLACESGKTPENGAMNGKVRA